MRAATAMLLLPLRERSNVSSVLVAGQVKKWQGKILGFDLPKLRRDLEASRDYLPEMLEPID